MQIENQKRFGGHILRQAMASCTSGASVGTCLELPCCGCTPGALGNVFNSGSQVLEQSLPWPAEPALPPSPGWTCSVPLLSWQTQDTFPAWSHLCLPHSRSKGGALSCFACCHLLTLSHLILLFSCHRSPYSRTFPGRIWCLQRCWECPQWLTFIFICRHSRNFFSPLTHSSQLSIIFSLEYFSHQFFFPFPLGSSRITRPQFTASENWRYFPPLSLSCFGICNLLPPFLFSYKKQRVPYMMAYIKQFFIDLGSAYSFLEDIQIWLGNWNTCMLYFLKREKASVLILKRKLLQINKPRLGSSESFVPVKIIKKNLILLLYFWRTEQRSLIEVDRVCLNWRLSKSEGHFYTVTCPKRHNRTSQESQLSLPVVQTLWRYNLAG